MQRKIIRIVDVCVQYESNSRVPVDSRGKKLGAKYVAKLHVSRIRLASSSQVTSSESMPLNIPGILVPFHLLVNPRLVIPSLAVKGEPATLDQVKQLNPEPDQKDIRHIDFKALKTAGYRGAVVDKDNCLVRGDSNMSGTLLTRFL
jgi:hypothetical protein